MRKNNRFTTVLTMLLMAAMVLTACNAPVPAADPAPVAEGVPVDEAAPASGLDGVETIKIGQMASASGSSATWGIAEVRGAEMAAEDINAAGGINGIPVEIVMYDTKGEATEGISAINRLIDQDGVCAVIGGNMSDIVISTAPIFTEAKIPCIVTMASNTLCTVDENGNARDYAYRLIIPDVKEGKVLADFANDELKVTKVAILYEAGGDYAEGVRQQFLANYTGEVVADEAYQNGDADFRTQLAKIKATNPELIVMPGRYKDASLACIQAKELGISTTFLGSSGWGGFSLLEMGGEAVEGVYLYQHNSIEAPSVQEFRARYKEKYVDDIETNSFYAYDAVMVIAEAIKNADSIEGEALKDAIAAIDTDGLGGVVKFDPATHDVVGRDALIFTVKGGAFETYSTVEIK